MALSQMELNIIRKARDSARILLDQRAPINDVDVFYEGAPDFNTTITQQDLDDSFPGSGLTTAILADAIYASKQAKIAVDNGMVAMVILANIS